MQYEDIASLKASKYLLIALALVLILAATGWLLRNSIIQRLTGPVLAQYGLSISDVSLDGLASKNASISYLELEHENGTIIAIDDLTLAIGTSATGAKSYSAENITVELPAAADTETVELARLIEQLLSLPQTLLNTEISVAQLSVAPYPTARDLRWLSTGSQQTFTASSGTIDLSIEIGAGEDSEHTVEVSIRNDDGNVPEMSIMAAIQQLDTGIDLSGSSVLDLIAWTSLAESFSSSSGTAELAFKGHIPFDVSNSASFDAEITPSMPLQLDFAITADDVASVSVRSANTLKLSASYPENQWRLSGENLSLLMSYKQWKDVSINISDLECTNGPTCFTNMRLAMNNADLTIATASRLEISATQDIGFDENGIQMLVRPGADASLSGLVISGTEVAALDALLTSAATLNLTVSGWQLSADALDTSVQSLSLYDDMTFSAPYSIRTLSISDSNQALSMNATFDSPSAKLRRGDQTLTMPELEGIISLQDNEIAIEIVTVGLYHDASIHAQHDVKRETGRISIENGSISFDVQHLSARVSPWTTNLDVSAGTISFDMKFDWMQSDSGWQLDGQTFLELNNLAGAYGDTAFAGLTTKLESSYRTGTGIAVEPAGIEIDLVEVGLPIENISADVTLNPDALSADIENLRMHAFGGVIQAESLPF